MYEYKIVSDIIDTSNNEYVNKTINKLKVNGKKTWINNMKYGFSFLGYTYKVINDKTIIRIKRSNVDKFKKRVKEVNHVFWSHS